VSTPLGAEVDRAAALLSARGIESARLEAEVLLADALGTDRARVFLERSRVLAAALRERFAELVRRRADREPFQHLRGVQEFYSREFRVDSRVLIPRADTETLVERAIEALGAREAPRIVDVGTGSGVIAITLALELPRARAVAIDFCAAALEVARENARNLGALHRVEFRCGDLLEPVRDERFDLVVSNPPYVRSGDIAGLAVEVRDYEPRLALDGGPDGLVFYRRLAGAAPRVLSPAGSLLVEIGFGQAAAVVEIFAAAGFPRVEVFRDLAGVERVVMAAP